MAQDYLLAEKNCIEEEQKKKSADFVSIKIVIFSGNSYLAKVNKKADNLNFSERQPKTSPFMQPMRINKGFQVR